MRGSPIYMYYLLSPLNLCCHRCIVKKATTAIYFHKTVVVHRSYVVEGEMHFNKVFFHQVDITQQEERYT